MVRSVGITAVVLGLAWIGLAGAQSSAPMEKARYINVSEEGKPTQRCKLLQTWRESNGAPVFQVQAVESGEMMTIVGAGPQGAGGDPRAMTTRIFRWGRDNKPPAGAPLPPASAGTSVPPIHAAGTGLPPVSKPISGNGIPPVAAGGTSVPPVSKPLSGPSVPLVSKPLSGPSVPPALKPSAPTAQPTPTFTAAQKPSIAPAPAPAPAQPARSPYVLTANNSPLTPMGTQVIQYPSGPKQATQLPDASSASASPSRLSPLAAGSVAGQKSCNCDCPPPNCSNCKPCVPCGQSSCVSCTPSPMRQPFLSRLVKSNNPCNCTTVTCAPAQPPAVKPTAATPPTAAVAKTPTTAKPDDWRESWGKTEPWKAPVQTTSIKPTAELTKRADPAPIPMEPSKQADPLKDPGHYRDIVMNSQLSNNRIPREDKPPVGARLKQFLAQKPSFGTRTVQRGNPIPVEHPDMLPPPQSPGRMVQIAAEEPNAFWSPQPPPGMGQEKSQMSAANHRGPMPPQGMPPTIAGVPPSLPGLPPSIASASLGLAPPRGPVLMNPPRPPMAPYTSPPGPQQPMAPITGVSDAMGNAFTLPGTRRPIPADFGGTPQEPNGFDPPIQMGQGSPPIAYGMPAPGMARPPMPNRMAMGPQMPMGVNPLMSVPPTAIGRRNAIPSNGGYAAASASAVPANVSQSLATLKDSMYPSERETAAEQLSEVNWRTQPQVVEHLIKAAREDPAATVRVACVHALAQMKVNTAAVVALVRDLKSDRDPQVRHEAEEALGALSDSGIQQTSHK